MATASLSSTALFFVATNEATYAAAREGSGVSKYISQYGWVGQYFGGTYEVNQVFAGFDLSGLPANAQITAAKLTLTIAESFGTTVVEVRQHDFTNNSINAFVAGSQLANKPMLGGAVVNSGFIGSIAIDLTGLTRDGLAKFVLASTTQRTGAAPTGDTTTRVTAAKLDITYNLVTVITTTGSGSWTVPAGVTSVKVECWSGGQGGDAGSGGSGGNYVRKTGLAVTPGSVISYNVGAGGAGVGFASKNNGGATWFVNVSSYVAAAGGLMSGSAGGDVSYYGGQGGSGSFGISGGGGGSSHSAGAGGAAGTFNGSNPASVAGGASGSRAGGVQGQPGANDVEGGSGGGGYGAGATVNPGGAPGGGGGGGRDSGPTNGGNGGRGQIRLTWDISNSPPTPARRSPRSFFWF